MNSKIQLSDFEQQLLNKPEWILTKNNVIKKGQRLLGEVQENITGYTNENPGILPKEVMTTSPKIAKGENYLGLPWLILDYPRHFDKENIFAIRTMFWWGKFFSITLHISGKYKAKYSGNIVRHYEDLKKNEFQICINEDQWLHYIENENYKPAKEFSAIEFEKTIRGKAFIKLAKKISLEQWDDAIKILSDEFVRITKWLN